MLLLYSSLAVSALLLTVSVSIPKDGPTNWPMTILAHLFWPVTLLVVGVVARRSMRAHDSGMAADRG